MKEVLVLGGGGFIGRNIVEFLLKRSDCNVTAADIKKGSNWDEMLNNKNLSPRFKTIIADFTDISAFKNLDQSYDEIYMLAAVVGVNRTLKFPEDVIRTTTLLTMNTHPLHFDKEYVKDSEFGQILVNSCLTLSIVAGMSVSDVSQKAIANLCWTDIKLPAPVFIGDTIYAESEVIDKRESNSRPTQGIVSIKTRGTKADGTVFMTFDRSMLVAKQGHGIDK